MRGDRIPEYDILRLAACALVVVGHAVLWRPETTTELGQALMSGAGKLCTYIYSFHMQLFFILSGACACVSSLAISKTMVLKRFTRLMLPYFVFGALIVIPAFNYKSDSLLDVYRRFILLDFGRVMHIWFLPALFTVSVFNAFIHRIVENFASPPAIMVALSFLVLCVSEHVTQVDFLPILGILQFWFWYVVGAYVVPHMINWHPKRKSILWLYFGLSVFAYIMARLFIVNECECFKQELFFCFRLLRSMSACCATIVIAKMLVDKGFMRGRWMNMLTAASMTLYLYHDVFNRAVNACAKYFDWMNSSLGVIAIFVCKTIAVGLLSILMWFVLKRLNRWWRIALGG